MGFEIVKLSLSPRIKFSGSVDGVIFDNGSTSPSCWAVFHSFVSFGLKCSNFRIISAALWVSNILGGSGINLA